jgi:hypothetical protein
MLASVVRRAGVKAARGVGAARAMSAVPCPLSTLTEDEAMMKQAVADFARTKVAPRVRAMDEAAKMDPDIIKGM